MQDQTLRYEILKLNRKGRILHLETPKKVFGDLFNWLMDERHQEFILDDHGNKQRKMLAYCIEFPQNDDGSYDFTKVTDFRLVDGDEWATLPVRSFDLSVRTPSKLIRVPRVVRSMEYEGEGGEIKQGTSYNAVYDLYEGVCAYSGRKLKRSEGSRDHVVPINKGGQDIISNIVLSDKDINNRKGDRYNHQCGLPEVRPRIPDKSRESQLRRVNRIKKVPEWRYFNL